MAPSLPGLPRELRDAVWESALVEECSSVEIKARSPLMINEAGQTVVQSANQSVAQSVLQSSHVGHLVVNQGAIQQAQVFSSSVISNIIQSTEEGSSSGDEADESNSSADESDSSASDYFNSSTHQSQINSNASQSFQTNSSAHQNQQIVTQQTQRHGPILVPRPLGLAGSVRFRANPNMLQVSKSVKEEYEKRAARCMTLVLQDGEHYNFAEIVVPQEVVGVQQAELYLLLFCHSCPKETHELPTHCRAITEIGQHRGWIANLVEQLPQLRSLVLKVHLTHDTMQEGKKPKKMPCEWMVRNTIQDLYHLPKVEKLELYSYNYKEGDRFEGPKALISTYVRQSSETIDRSRLQC